MKATFGAGCFWQVEEAFRKVSGVIATSVGYMGGHFPNPSYLDVLSRITGHAEVAQIEYDRDRVTYEQLLEIFWSIHDPTQLNRQGPDRGEQYRSVIFYHDREQEKAARLSKQQLQQSGRFEKEIVTQIVPATDYYLADESHQQYFEKKRRELGVGKGSVGGQGDKETRRHGADADFPLCGASRGEGRVGRIGGIGRVWGVWFGWGDKEDSKESLLLSSAFIPPKLLNFFLLFHQPHA